MMMKLLSLESWTSQAKKHSELITPIADAFVKRRASGLKHPVHDFLFTYYNCSPLKLKQWVPSFKEKLWMTPQLREEHPWLTDYWFHLNGNILSMNRDRLNSNLRGLSNFIAELCENILHRPPRFGCFGLHEWAMVYKSNQEEIRHHEYPLRLSPTEIQQFVESQMICCSHYDAFRFFTKEAKPLNILNPTLETRIQMEQAGCVHANMDLYKWSTKLWPWLGSNFILRTFFLALDARELDMRASPYDLMVDGYLPIRIETEEGRKQYQQEQMRLTVRANILRKELLENCKDIILF